MLIGLPVEQRTQFFDQAELCHQRLAKPSLATPLDDTPLEPNCALLLALSMSFDAENEGARLADIDGQAILKEHVHARRRRQ